jgi:hypothetical protein
LLLPDTLVVASRPAMKKDWVLANFPWKRPQAPRVDLKQLANLGRGQGESYSVTVAYTIQDQVRDLTQKVDMLAAEVAMLRSFIRPAPGGLSIRSGNSEIVVSSHLGIEMNAYQVHQTVLGTPK